MASDERVPARHPATPAGTPLRDVLAEFATGVTVLTVAGERPHGMTANSVTSVSLDPPLVLCCVARTARMHDAIASTGRLGVSVLGRGQEQLARYFADKRRPEGAAQFDRVDWCPGPYTGAPLLSGALAWLECEVAETYEGGDHSIFLSRVLDATRRDRRLPGLVFFRSAFHRAVADQDALTRP